MGSPFDQTLGWMPGMAVPPWGDSPVPAGPYPVPAPVDLAPFDPGAPASVNGTFSIPPWEHRPVPDLAGAAQAGAQIADQARAVQPEQLPPEPVPIPTVADYMAQQIRLHGAPPEPVNVGGAPSESPHDFVLRMKAMAPAQPSLSGEQPQAIAPPPGPMPSIVATAKPDAEPTRPPPSGVPGTGPMDPNNPPISDLERSLAGNGAPAWDAADRAAYMASEQPGEPVDQAGAREEPDTGAPATGRPVGAIGQWVGAQPVDPFAGVEEKVAQGDTADLMAKAPLDPYDPGAISNRREAMAQAYANATPEERAAMDAREAALYATKRQTMEMQQAEADRKAVEDNARIAKQAREKAARDMAQLQADVQGMADSSPFEAWWSDRSTLGKLGGIVSAIFSGLANPTGPNGAIDMMMKTADADAAQKWKKIEARRQLLGEQRAANQDDATERERVRLASREQAIRMIEAQMNGLDPEGTQALALGHTIAGLRADDMRAKQAYMADQEKSAFAQGKAEVDAYNAESQRMQARAQMLNAESLAYQRGMGRGAGGGGGGAGGVGVPGAGALDPSAWVKYAGGNEKMRPPYAMNEKQYKAWLDVQAKAGNIAESDIRGSSVSQKTELTEGALMVSVPGFGNLTRADGKPYLAADDTERAATTGKVHAAVEIASMIDEILSIRDRVGGESEAFNSDERQQLDVLQNRLTILAKSGTQGMSSDEDMKKLTAALGAASVASFRARAAGLKEGRQRTVSELNSWLSTHGNGGGYDGKPITIPNQYNQPRAKRDPDLDAIMKRDGGEGFGFKPIATPPTTWATGPIGPAGPAGPGAGPPAKAPIGPQIPTAPQAALDRLEAKASQDGPAGEAAVRMLYTAATAANGDPVGAAAAARVLMRLAAKGNKAALAYAHGADDGPTETVYQAPVPAPTAPPSSGLMMGD